MSAPQTPQFQAPGPYSYPAGQAAPEPKKKRKVWLWVLGVVFALIALGSVLPSKDKGSNIANAPSVKVEASQSSTGGDAAAAGSAVRDGKFEFVVGSVNKGQTTLGDNPYFQEKAQGQFVVVSVQVKNISDKPQSFTPSAQKIVDTQGRTFESDSAAQIALGGSDIPVWDNINPGNTAAVKLVYDMPADAVPAALELHDSMFSGGAKVKLAS